MRHALSAAPIALLMICASLLTAVPSEAATPSGWGQPEFVDRPDLGPCYVPTGVLDDHGNAVVVWMQSIGLEGYVEPGIWANRHVPGSGWSGQQIIGYSYYGIFDGPRAVVDSKGNVTVVWVQVDASSGRQVFSNSFVPGLGWSYHATRVSDLSQPAGTVAAACADDDSVFAAWTQSDGTRANVFASRFVPGVGWGTPGLIETDDSGSGTSLHVAAGGDGYAAATWRVYDGARYNIWGNVHVPDGGWGTAQLLEALPGTASGPRAAVDSGGNATVAWRQMVDERNSILANRFTPVGGWGGAQLLEQDDVNHANEPDVWADGHGNAIVVWPQTHALKHGILENRYVAGVGWGEPRPIEDLPGYSGDPRIGGDAQGCAVVVFSATLPDMATSIASNRYVPGEGWGEAELIEEYRSAASNHRMSVNRPGDALAVWVQIDGVFGRAAANRYTAPDTTPPELSVLEPADGTTTDTPVVRVSGVTEPWATVSVAGVLTEADPATGAFSVNIALSEGENAIEVVATDAAGNSRSVTVTVTYHDTVRELLADLSERLDALLGELGDDTSLAAELEAIKEHLASLGDSLNATRELLDDTVDRVGETEDQDGAGTGGFALGLVGGLIGAAALLGLYMVLGRRKAGTVAKGQGEEPEPPEE